MKTFWIKKIVNKNRKYYSKYLNITFVILAIVCFSIFSFYYKLTRLVFSTDKINLYKESLQEIAFYFRNFDRELSQTILKFDDILKDQTNKKNILVTKEKEIKEIRNYIKKNKQYISKLWFSNYENIISFVGKLREFQDEIFNLLGKTQEFNYLIILQNTNEKRPNWWFFGSFAFVSFKEGHIKDLEIIDAYYPDFISHNTYIKAPERSETFLPKKEIWFIAANKFWFTDIDGKNIKTLYEKMFNKDYVMRKVKKTMRQDLYEKLLHKYIKWVIFIRSDLFEEIIPWFTKKERERQFVNASIDLVRWEKTGNKKEIYIKEITDFFNKKKYTISKNIVHNFDKILEKNYIQIYLSNVSTGLNNLLKANNLNNQFSNWKIYARDTNDSYNKVDWFITKNIQIKNSENKIIIDTHNDIVNIKYLPKWKYFMKILYSLNVPPYYKNFIKELEQKYDIQITDRERWILALQPAKHFERVDARRRESKATIYFPLNTKILSFWWDTLEYKEFSTPFANWVFYRMNINKNNVTKSLTIKFEIN